MWCLHHWLNWVQSNHRMCCLPDSKRWELTRKNIWNFQPLRSQPNLNQCLRRYRRCNLHKIFYLIELNNNFKLDRVGHQILSRIKHNFQESNRIVHFDLRIDNLNLFHLISEWAKTFRFEIIAPDQMCHWWPSTNYCIGRLLFVRLTHLLLEVILLYIDSHHNIRSPSKNTIHLENHFHHMQQHILIDRLYPILRLSELSNKIHICLRWYTCEIGFLHRGQGSNSRRSTVWHLNWWTKVGSHRRSTLLQGFHSLLRTRKLCTPGHCRKFLCTAPEFGPRLCKDSNR